MLNVIAELHELGFLHFSINNNGDKADLSCLSPYGETVGIIVYPKSLYADDLIRKKYQQLPIYRHWLCLCHIPEYDDVQKIVGREYCVRQGAEFSHFLKKLC